MIHRNITFIAKNNSSNNHIKRSSENFEINNKATNNNGEPLAFSMNEMGSGLSDTYSYLDMSAEDLSAKGNGGLRMMHSYTGWSDNQSIATPPEDYVPNKVGEVDMGKLQARRNQEIAQKR